MTGERTASRGLVLLAALAALALAIGGALFSATGSASAQDNDDNGLDDNGMDNGLDDNGVDDNGMDDGVDDNGIGNGVDDNGVDDGVDDNGIDDGVDDDAMTDDDAADDREDPGAPDTGTGNVGGQGANTGTLLGLMAAGVVAMAAGATGFVLAGTKRNNS